MKIRNGFVSNSSSSSFIVAFSEIPNSVEEIKRMMFGDALSVDVYDYVFSTEEISKEIFKDMKDNGVVIDNSKIVREINSGWYPGMPDYDYDWKDEKASKEYYEKCKKGAAELAEKFISANAGAHFFIFEYCDNDGPFYSTMEHGEIFSKLPHLQISKH